MTDFYFVSFFNGIISLISHEQERTTLPPVTTEFTTIDSNFTNLFNESLDNDTSTNTISMVTEQVIRRKKRDEKLVFDDDDNPDSGRSSGPPVQPRTKSQIEEDFNSTGSWYNENATDIWSTEIPTTETPPSGDRLIRAVANDTYCETCTRQLSTKSQDGMYQLSVLSSFLDSHNNVFRDIFHGLPKVW